MRRVRHGDSQSRAGRLGSLVRFNVLKIGITIVVVALLGLVVFWLTTWRFDVTVGYAEHWIHTSPPGFAGVVGKPEVKCHHAKGGFLGVSRVDYCTATYSSGAAYHCRVWNPDQGVGDGMKCNPTPFRKARAT
jgi:hypothetical protein